MRRFFDNADTFIQPLEPRCLLAIDGPLPSLASLENQANPVARLITNYGDIDIELFQDTNPVTVANFIDYIERGEFDQLFFHHLVQGVSLHSGGFHFTDRDSATVVLPDPFDHTIPNEFVRSNVERTLAMQTFQGPDSATSYFFINLADNSGTFDSQQNTVFARIATDESWSVVTTIANLPVVDMQNNPAFTDPTHIAYAANFDAVSGGPTATESNLVIVWDAEVIKATATDDFYDEAVRYPEGFAGSNINEFLPIGNPNDAVVYYQVIARSEIAMMPHAGEYDWFRDKVIATGTIAPNSRGGITVSQFSASDENLVEQGRAYSLEVRSTLPLVANLSHYDFGSATGENFTAQAAQHWTFADARKSTIIAHDFLVWTNPNLESANLALSFILDNGTVLSTTVQTERLRRGGLSISELEMIPDGSTFSIVIDADQPIVAAMTDYVVRDGNDRTGFTELGVPGDASTRGVIPMGNASVTARQLVAFYNPSATDAAPITLTFSFSDGSGDFTISPAALQLAPGRRATFDVGAIPELNNGRRFTLRYSSVGVGVFAHTSNEQFGDTVAYPVGLDGATRWDYAEGFTDPARAGTDVFETLSMFNPNFGAMGRADIAANVHVRLYFTGGSVVVEDRVLAPGGRLDVDIDQLQSVIDHITSTQDYYYSIEVTSNAPIVSQLWHFDQTLGSLQTSGGFGELGAPGGDVVRLG